jgi:hypothetical protein
MENLCRCARFPAEGQVDSEAVDLLEGASRVSVLGLGVADLGVLRDRKRGIQMPCLSSQFRMKALFEM